MSGRARMLEMLDRRRSRWSLPGPFYTDPDFFHLDMEAIYERRWLYAGLECEIAEPGQFFTLEIGKTSIIVCRDRAGEARGFFNSCRHRGSIICDAQRGKRATFVCPYHQWSYDFTGRLLRAPNMDDAIDKSEFGLKPIHVAVIAGVIYVCLAERAPDIAPFATALEPRLAPHRLRDAKVVHEITLREQGNWKLVMENSRECDHCNAGHPELMQTLLLFDFADPWSDPVISEFWKRCEAQGVPSVTRDGADFRVGRLPFKPGNLSITPDGKEASKKRLGELPSHDFGSLRWALYPSNFNHAHADYAIFVRMLPTGPEETLVNCKWVVHKDAIEGEDYDLKRLVEVWATTNDQDRELVERNQRGVRSVGYQPGPYAESSEHGVWTFVEWYCHAMQDHLRGPAASVRSAA